MADREEYEAAKAAERALEKRRQALLKPTDAAWAAVQERTEAARTLAAYTCEHCSEPIFDGELACVSEDGATCKDCSPTYRDLQENPDHYYRTDDDGEAEPYTAESIAPFIEEHLAKGGSLDDTLARPV